MSEISTAPQRRRPSRRAAILLAGGIAALAFALDQASKLWVEQTLALGEQIDVLPPVLYFRHHLNPGAAFSMGTDYTWIFTLIQATVLVLALWWFRRLGGSWLWALALGGLAGGVAGNLTDRLFRPMAPGDGGDHTFGLGAVVDFIGVPNFAVFNVADSFIVCSIIGLCALMIFGWGIDGSRERAEASDKDETPAS
ncbi:signal peptidase II [Nesterenkonia sp. NBAIMH1]|uniref:signal peptidase II n=1 Tax=Nesterenkonia sp. NBAIMH1 TaxID=2600320 RepID=UPI001AEFB628|nr:signal peptidase II [Nesterenkonia sp. NBAIMH1]